MKSSGKSARQRSSQAQPITGSAYKAVLEQLQEGVIITSLDGSFRRMNQTAAGLYGFASPAAFEKRLDAITDMIELRTYPDRQPIGMEDWPLTRLRGGQPRVHDTYYVTRLDTGREVILEYTGKIVQAKKGELALAVLTLRDVTAHRQAEREQVDLLVTTARQSAFFRTALDAIVTIDHTGLITEFNPAAERAFGYSRTEALGHELASLIIPPRYRARHRHGLARFLSTGKGRILDKPVEISAIRRDGSEFPVELFVTRIGDKDPPTFMGTLRDITERKRAEQSLRESEQRLRFMAESMPQKIFTTLPDGTTDYVNPQWTEFTGMSLEDIVEQGWGGYVHPDDLAATRQAWAHSLKTGRQFEFEHRFRRADGTYIWHLSRAHAMRDDDGAIVRWIGSNTDIEDVRRRKALEFETARLKEINHAKDEFIALASHQLRTPATGVKQYIGMLQQGYFGGLSDQQREVVQTAYDSNERQLDIINALLNVAQLDAGTVSLKPESCRLDKLVKDTLHDLAENFQLRNQILDVKLKTVTADVDARLMRMVLENVIDNACKYTPENKTISVRLSVGAAHGAKHITIAVADQGVGIRKADQSRLFQKFSRIDNDLSTQANGSGLGLYWAKKIIDLHGGSISVNSRARRGSVFTVTLPYRHP